MTAEGVYEPKDELTLPDGTSLIAVPADTDGSGCYVCDNGHEQCYFAHREGCPKCHSDRFIWIDYIGGRVIFLEKD